MDKAAFIAKVGELMASYAPSAAVKAQIAQLELVVIIGPTGVGKTAILQKCGLHYALSDVTRQPREGEKDGRDYNFRSDYDTLASELERGEFVQFVLSYTGEFYGTRAESFPPKGPAVMQAVATAVLGLRMLGFASMRPIYILAPTYEEWLRRQLAHNDDDMAMRMKEARQSLNIALHDEEFVFIVNDNLKEAVKNFKAAAAGQLDRAASDSGRELAEAQYQRVLKGE